MPSTLPSGSRDAVSLLALFLYTEARTESVRTREALAAAIVNQVRRRSAQRPAPAAAGGAPRRAQLFVACLDALGAAEATPPERDDPTFASCLRIARRAVSGALGDPTHGATRFHRLAHSPDACDLAASGTWIGPYLFSDDEPQAAVDSAGPAG